MPKQITLRDVAQVAGVSVTTVSNVMRDWPYVSSETRDRVQRAVTQLGYTPHLLAQGLRTGQTQALAFIVPNLSNPYFAEIVAAAEDVAAEKGYTILVFNSHENHERERACIRRAKLHWVDGLLISHITTAEDDPEFLRDMHIPVVAIDRVPYQYEGALCAVDHVQTGRIATAHLADLGHRKIAHIAGPAPARPATERLQGYHNVLDEYGLAYRRVLACSTAWGSDDGYRLMRELLDDDDPPTAIFASNDRVVIGALHAIQERGRRVPEDFSLIGVDDIETSRHLNPPITTVRQPLDRMARAGVEILLAQIRGDNIQPDRVFLEPELVIRQSTARFPESEAR